MEYISCNMGTCDLPEIYTLALGLRPRARVYISGKSLVPEIYTLALGLRPRARVYISGKSLVPMLQLLHMYGMVEKL